MYNNFTPSGFAILLREDFYNNSNPSGFCSISKQIA